MDALDAELEIYRQRFSTNLDGRWGVLLEDHDPTSPAYAVYLFHGATGSREGMGGYEGFTCEFPEPHLLVLTWQSGDAERIPYEFSIVHAGTRRLVLNTRGRSVFSGELGPLALTLFH